MTFEEMAWEFAEVFDELGDEQVNEMLSKNVPFETLQFFNKYAHGFGDSCGIADDTAERLPNLMLIGYLVHLLEERLLPNKPAN
jgi:hypothetical protein